MNRIHLLSEQVANQIAAGEVVERPASVVKELVENSIDAEATRITVEIQAGGRSLIRVTDNGFGMSKDDALLCMERHATSKIRRAEDLSAISTMGFRGEALPSIASVSRFMLTTCERDGSSPEGTRILIGSGKILEVKSAGSAAGTSVEVRQIFFNLPARRKFLRSEETESAHIQHYLTLAALSHPEVAFDFIKDGRTCWQLPALQSENQFEGKVAALKERLRSLSGEGTKFLAVNFSGELPGGPEDFVDSAHGAPPSKLQVWGFVGAPGVARSTREEQHIFVNRRPVENRGLNFALLEGYHTALMKGRYPVCCLFLEIDPGEVDVNIHPAKREVKFHRERAVRELVTQAVRETLLKFHSAAASPPADVARPTAQSEKSATITIPPPPPDFRLAPSVDAAAPPQTADLPHLPRLSKPVANWPGAASTPIETVDRPPAREPREPVLRPTASAGSLGPSPGGAVPLLHIPLRLVGVIGKLYVVLESDRGLVLLDQHAAHERILFEQMLRRLEQGSVPSQRLLLPETVELSVRDAQFLREHLAVLTRLGLGLSEFGERTFLLDALPPFVRASEPRRFVLELIDELKATGQTVNALRLGEQTIAKTVCRHAVKANDPLAGPELENLVQDLRQCEMPYTCPHGRPTLIEMNFRELERKFGRTQ